MRLLKLYRNAQVYDQHVHLLYTHQEYLVQFCFHRYKFIKGRNKTEAESTQFQNQQHRFPRLHMQEPDVPNTFGS